MLFNFLLGLLLASPAAAQKTAKEPTYVSLLPNINDYGRFADNGPDENWYVGFNNAWIVQLPNVPAVEYARAFIGAKIGRAKTRAKMNKPWERELIKGAVYIGISQKPAFTSEQSFFLADTLDIPLDADPRFYAPGSGASQWFWAEVPQGLVSSTQPNYLIVWSPTEYFVAAGSAPILAAAERSGLSSEPVAWVNRSIQGVPPRKPNGALETPINNLFPAVAIKLVPANDYSVRVTGCHLQVIDRRVIFGYGVVALNADRAWVEISRDRLDWERVSRMHFQPPYLYTLPLERLARGAYIRGVARDVMGNQGECDAVSLPSQ